MIDHANWGGGLLHFSWIFWIFVIVLGSMYKGGALYDLILAYRFLPKDLWIFLGWGVGLIYIGMPVQYVMRLPRTWIWHLLSSLPNEEAKDDGVCLSSYTINRHFSKLCHLAIILSHGLWHAVLDLIHDGPPPLNQNDPFLTFPLWYFT